MAKAKLLYRSKLIYQDGSIREMVIWHLPTPTPERPHGLKYRLFYGNAKGECLVRYDNETGKGDHRHTIEGEEEPYTFINVETLVADFQRDIDIIRRSQ
jgi:hypothetical protein